MSVRHTKNRNYFLFLGLTMALVRLASSAALPSEATPWWTDPCRQPISPVFDKLRHGRSADERHVILTQLTYFINSEKELFREWGGLYSKNKSDIEKVPKKRFKWMNVKKLINDLKATKGFNTKLKKLHNTLQLFAGVLEKLSHIQLRSQGEFKMDSRERIIYQTKLSLRPLLCEVSEGLISANKKPKKRLLKEMDINIPEHTDLTNLFILDVNIFKKIKWFSIQIKRKVLKRKGKRMRNGINSDRRLRNRAHKHREEPLVHSLVRKPL